MAPPGVEMYHTMQEHWDLMYGFATFSDEITAPKHWAYLKKAVKKYGLNVTGSHWHLRLIRGHADCREFLSLADMRAYHIEEAVYHLGAKASNIEETRAGVLKGNHPKNRHRSVFLVFEYRPPAGKIEKWKKGCTNTTRFAKSKKWKAGLHSSKSAGVESFAVDECYLEIRDQKGTAQITYKYIAAGPGVSALPVSASFSGSSNWNSFQTSKAVRIDQFKGAAALSSLISGTVVGPKLSWNLVRLEGQKKNAGEDAVQIHFFGLSLKPGVKGVGQGLSQTFGDLAIDSGPICP